MKKIPVSAARAIADLYDYDQVIVIARKVGGKPDPRGEHVTTYGAGPVHCGIAARAGRALQRFMGWPLTQEDPVVAALNAAVMALRSYQYGNGAPDLAASIADAGDAALIKVGLPPATLVDAKRIEAGEQPLAPVGIDPPVTH